MKWKNEIIMKFSEIADIAGFIAGVDGKFNLPANQDTANKLVKAVLTIIPEWEIGQPAQEVILTGPGPIWAYMIIGHALHGRVAKLTYAAPNAEIVIYNHGM